MRAERSHGHLSDYDTLDFEAPVAIGGTGDVAFRIPANINSVFLGPDAWVQGKLFFGANDLGTGVTKKIYGPGVLDVSRFRYDDRHCDRTSAIPQQGYEALTAVNAGGNTVDLDSVALDGIIILEQNFYATAKLTNSTVNNVKTISWNGNNDGLEFGTNTVASNVFDRSRGRFPENLGL